MKFLLIEDDELKRVRLTEFILEHYAGAQIENARSLQSALRCLLTDAPDLILLDMNLPNYDITPEESGGRLQQFAGRELLRQLRRRKIAKPVIIVTAFDYFGEGKDKITLAELDGELRENFGENYKGAVYYHPTLDDWKRTLPDMIQKALAEN